MKVCFKCSTAKPLDDFYKHPKMGDGHLGKCKECTKRDVALRFASKKQDLARLLKERARHRAKSAAARATGNRPSQTAEYEHQRTLRWRSRNPEKRKAHNIVNHAIRSGALRKQPCEQCGAEPAQAHHDDYSKPLNVRWLCPKHHGEHHTKQNAEALKAKFMAALNQNTL